MQACGFASISCICCIMSVAEDGRTCMMLFFFITEEVDDSVSFWGFAVLSAVSGSETRAAISHWKESDLLCIVAKVYDWQSCDSHNSTLIKNGVATGLRVFFVWGCFSQYPQWRMFPARGRVASAPTACLFLPCLLMQNALHSYECHFMQSDTETKHRHCSVSVSLCAHGTVYCYDVSSSDLRAAFCRRAKPGRTPGYWHECVAHGDVTSRVGFLGIFCFPQLIPLCSSMMVNSLI